MVRPNAVGAGVMLYWSLWVRLAYIRRDTFTCTTKSSVPCIFSALTMPDVAVQLGDLAHLRTVWCGIICKNKDISRPHVIPLLLEPKV